MFSLFKNHDFFHNPKTKTQEQKNTHTQVK